MVVHTEASREPGAARVELKAIGRRNRRGPITVLVGVFLAMMALGAGIAGAHNELTGVEPVDGSTITRDDTISFRFVNAVPLDTMTVEAVDATGARTPVTGLRHGATTSEVVVAAADLPVGALSLRWRLVGPDGHVITDRVQFVVGDSGPASPTSTLSADAGGDTASPGAPIRRWLWRAASYAALMALVGAGFAERWLWQGFGTPAVLHRVATVSLAVVGVLALVQVVELAAQIEGVGVDAAVGRWRSAMRTRAGAALVFRAVLTSCALVFGAVAARFPRIVVDGIRMAVLVLLLGSWSLTGHAASGRWPVVGVVLDATHHGAAAAWLGGLAVLAVGLRTMTGDTAAPLLVRFSMAAPWLVGTLVATGVLGKLRLLDAPSALVGAHSSVLLAKLVVVACMLWIADVNRRRVQRWCDGAESLGIRRISVLRRAMTTEAAIGAVVVAVTAVLVVTTP